jgi:Protein of unknown function (DUF3141)
MPTPKDLGNDEAAFAMPLLPGMRAFSAATEYLIDSWQRAILTWDVLRERGDRYLEHERKGDRPVLPFDRETVLDGRKLPKPVNYALIRIKPQADHPPTDPKQRPFVVIDGGGPDTGSLSMESEIGLALKRSHPCYLIMSFPEPLPGQTIESVRAAEGTFLHKVAELHPEAQGKPFLIGNRQSGGALMMLAALDSQNVGPILLAGGPLSYWTGVVGKASGRLNLANAYWKNLFELYSKVDTEPGRFLESETWWGGPTLVNRADEARSFDRQNRVDLGKLRSPIIVFASWREKVTPAQQALAWIPDLYASVEDIRLNRQTIVYCLHEKAGHLGIFVSGGAARRESPEKSSALELIDRLPPGLYEAVVTDTRPELGALEFVEGRYLVQFAPRTIEDVLALNDGREEKPLELVDRVAQINQGLFDAFVSPWVRMFSSAWSASALRIFNPVRIERWAFSDLNPAMLWVKAMAAFVRDNRRPAPPDNPFVKLERKMSKQIIDVLGRRGPRPISREQEELRRRKRKAVEDAIDHGTVVDAWARLLLYVRPPRDAADQRPFNMVRRLIEEVKPESTPSFQSLRESLKRQAFVLALDEERALAALPKLAPDMAQRQRGFDVAKKVMKARGKLTPQQHERLQRIAVVLGLDSAQESMQQ